MIQAQPQYKNLIFIALMGILIFTPLGRMLKIQLLRLVSTTPKTENATTRQISSYSGYFFDAQGCKILFSESENRLTFVNFWATWCPACVAEKPAIHRLYEKYANRLNFITLVNESPHRVEDFMQKHGYSFPVYYKERNFPAELYSQSIPASFLIDQTGKILIEQKGAAHWDSPQMQHLLDSLLKTN